MTFKKWIAAGLLVLLSFPLLACGEATTTTTADGLDYDDFEFIDYFYQIWNRSASGGDYLVYLYSTDDTPCERLKDDILEFADTYSDHRIYFFDVTDLTTSDQYFTTYFHDMTGLTSIPYPALLLIENRSFDKTKVSQYFFSGAGDIRSILYDLQNGTRTFG